MNESCARLLPSRNGQHARGRPCVQRPPEPQRREYRVCCEEPASLDSNMGRRLRHTSRGRRVSAFRAMGLKNFPASLLRGKSFAVKFRSSIIGVLAGSDTLNSTDLAKWVAADRIAFAGLSVRSENDDLAALVLHRLSSSPHRLRLGRIDSCREPLCSRRGASDGPAAALAHNVVCRAGGSALG